MGCTCCKVTVVVPLTKPLPLPNTIQLRPQELLVYEERLHVAQQREAELLGYEERLRVAQQREAELLSFGTVVRRDLRSIEEFARRCASQSSLKLEKVIKENESYCRTENYHLAWRSAGWRSQWQRQPALPPAV